MMKMKAGFSLDEITIQRINVMAAETHREKSSIVDMAVELLAQQDEFSDIKFSKRPAKVGLDSIKGVSKAKVS